MYGDQLVRERAVLRMRLRRDAEAQLPAGQALDFEDLAVLVSDGDGSYRSRHVRDHLVVRGLLQAGYAIEQAGRLLRIPEPEVTARAAAPLLASPGIAGEIDRVVVETLIETPEPGRYGPPPLTPYPG